MNFKTTVEREKAEAYVRSQIKELMELSFGCRVKVKNEEVYYTAIGKPYHNTNWDFVKVAEYKDVDNGLNTLGLEIIGHPIQPHHWLKCVVEATNNRNWMLNSRNEIVDMTNFGNRHFKNEYLIIGTERFYQSFKTIVGI